MAKVIKTAIISAVVAVVTVVILGPAGLGVLNTAGASLTVGSLTLTGTAAVAATYAAIAFVGTAVAGGVGMLTSRGISASRGNFGTKIAGRGAQVPRQIVYGECRVGGTIVKMHTSGTKNNKLHLAIVLAGHEIESLDGVYLNDTLLNTSTTTVGGETVYRVTNAKYKNTDNEHEIDTNGTLIQYTFHDGSQTTVDGLASTNASSRYPSTAKFQGMAYVYMEIIYDPEKMPSLPPLSFRIKGKKVYDPRNSTTAYSNNPALIIRDYLVDTTYGLRALSSEINDTTAGGGFAAAANACDAAVTLEDNSTTEARFTLNGFVNAASSGDGILEGFLTSCAGKLTYTNGKFNIFVGTAQTPTLTITDEDVLDTQQLSTKTGNGDLFNGIKALYVDKEQNYQGAESPLLVDSTYLAEDTPSGEQSANYKKILETQLPFTTTHQRAQRIQKIQLRRQRESATLTMLTTLEFMKLQPGDWVNVTNTRFSYNAKSFEVLSVAMEFGENDGVLYAATRLVLQEVSASVYDYVYSEYSTPQTAGSTPPGGDLSVGSPTAVSLAQRTRPEGPTAKIDIIVSWTNAAETGVQGTEIQYKESGESTYDVATIAGRGATSAVIQNVQVGKIYDVRIRHFSWDNVYGSFVSFDQLTISEPDTLSAPGNPSATTDKPFFIELTWTNPTNANFRAVEVHYSTSSGFTPDSNSLLNTYYGEPGKQKKVILGVSAGLSYDTNYYFKLRSVNVYGTTSGYTNQATGQFKKAQNADVENLNASAITAGTIDASTITVENIDAGEISTGTLDSSRVNAGEIVVGGLESGVTIDAGSLTMSAGGHIKGGQTSYNDTSNSGFFLGYDTDAYKLSIGSSATKSLTFNGTDLTIGGSVNIGSTAASTVESGAAAGATASQVNKGLALLVNQNAAGTSNAGEAATVGVDKDGVPDLDTDGFIIYNGSKITVPHDEVSGFNLNILTSVANKRGFICFDANKTQPFQTGQGGFTDYGDLDLAFVWKEGDQWYYDQNGSSSAGIEFTPSSITGTRNGTDGTTTPILLAIGFLETSTSDQIVSGGLFEPIELETAPFPSDTYDSGTIGGIKITGSAIESSNFSAGSAGFQIGSDGDAEFNSGSFRGTLTVGSTDLTETNTLNANTTASDVGLGNVDNTNSQNTTQNGLISGTTITGGGITLSSGGVIKGGQTAFNTGTGFFLGYSTVDSVADYRFSIGDSTNSLVWDGSDLTVTGGITADSFELTSGVTAITDPNDLVGNTNNNAFFRYETTAANDAVAAPTDTEFNTAFGRDPRTRDVVIVVNTASNPDVSAAYIYNGSSWDAKNDFLTGDLIVDGTVKAANIDVNDLITSGSLLTDSATINNDIRIGSGESVFSADSNGIYLGNETFADAEFRVTPAGVLNATGATISGAITATSLTLSGTSIAESQLATDVQTSLGLADSASQVNRGLAILINKQISGASGVGEAVIVGVDKNGAPDTSADGFIVYNGSKITLERLQYASTYTVLTGLANITGFIAFDTNKTNPFDVNGNDQDVALVYKVGNQWKYDPNNASGVDFTPSSFTGTTTGTDGTTTANIVAIGYMKTSTADLIEFAGLFGEAIDLELAAFPTDTIQSGTVGGISIDANSINSGSHTSFGSTATGFHIGSNGQISIGDGSSTVLSFDSQSDVPTLDITGVITATRVTVGSGATTAAMSADGPVRFWAGSENPSSTTPFVVESDGEVFARNLVLTDADGNEYFNAQDGFTALALTTIAGSSSGVKVTTYSEAFSSGTGTDQGDNGEIEVAFEQTSNVTFKAKISGGFRAYSTSDVESTAQSNAIDRIPDNVTVMLRRHTSSGFTSSQGTLIGTTTFTKTTNASPSTTQYRAVAVTDFFDPELEEYFAAASITRSLGAVGATGQLTASFTVSSLASGTYYIKAFVSTSDTNYDSTFNKVTSSTARTIEILDNTTDGGFTVDGGANQSVGAADITGVTAGTNLTGGGSSGTVTLNLDSTISGDHTFSNNLTVSGDLTVSGTTTTLNTATLDVEDKNITLNYGTGDTSSTADGAGITIQDAVNSSTDATLTWSTGSDRFVFSHPLVISGVSDASLSSTSHGLQVGDTSGLNVIIDDNEIMARDNGANSVLHLQADGGDVEFRNNASGTTNLKISGNTFLDQNRNATLGTISSGKVTITGNSDDGDEAPSLIINDTDSDAGSKIPAIYFKGSGTGQARIRGGDTEFAIGIGSSYTDALTFNLSNNHATFAAQITTPGFIRSLNTVANAVPSTYAAILAQQTESGIQVIAENSGSWASWMGLTNVNTTSGAHRHYWWHNVPSTSSVSGGEFELRTSTTTTADEIGGQGSGSTQLLSINTDGDMTLAGDLSISGTFSPTAVSATTNTGEAVITASSGNDNAQLELRADTTNTATSYNQDPRIGFFSANALKIYQYWDESASKLTFSSDAVGADPTGVHMTNNGSLEVDANLNLGATLTQTKAAGNLATFGSSSFDDKWISIRGSGAGLQLGLHNSWPDSGGGILAVAGDSKAFGIATNTSADLDAITDANVHLYVDGSHVVIQDGSLTSTNVTPYETSGALTIYDADRSALNLAVSNGTGDSYVFFADTGAGNAGYLGYEHTTDQMVLRSSGPFKISTGSTAFFYSESSVNANSLYVGANGVGVLQNTPDHALHVKGDLSVDNELETTPTSIHLNATNKSNYSSTSRINFWEGNSHTLAVTDANGFIEYDGSADEGDNGATIIGGYYSTYPNQRLFIVPRDGQAMFRLPVAGATAQTSNLLRFQARINLSTTPSTVTIGQIGCANNDNMTIGSGGVGLIFNRSASQIYPWNVAGNAGSNNVISLGNIDRLFHDIHYGGELITYRDGSTTSRYGRLYTDSSGTKLEATANGDNLYIDAVNDSVYIDAGGDSTDRVQITAPHVILGAGDGANHKVEIGERNTGRGFLFEVKNNLGTTASDKSTRMFMAETGFQSGTDYADRYGLSLVYDGVGSTAFDSGFTSTMANGEWGFYGHENDDQGTLILHSSRNGSFFNIKISGSNALAIDSSRNVNLVGAVYTTGSSISVDPASGDAVLNLMGAAGAQTLRIDQNSIRTTTSSNLNLFTSGNTNQLFLNQSSGGVGIYKSTSLQGNLHVADGESGASAYQSGNGGITIESSGRAALNFLTPNTQDAYIFWGDPETANQGYIGYEHSTNLMIFKSATRFRFATGRVGIDAPSGTPSGSNTNCALEVGPLLNATSSAVAQIHGFVRLERQIIIHDPNNASNTVYWEYDGGNMHLKKEGSGTRRLETGDINISDANTRIYFNSYRAIEGAQDGTNLQIGENYTNLKLQTTNIWAGDTGDVAMTIGYNGNSGAVDAQKAKLEFCLGGGIQQSPQIRFSDSGGDLGWTIGANDYSDNAFVIDSNNSGTPPDIEVNQSYTAFDFAFLPANKNFYASGNVIAYSDRRVKDNIETIDNALERVKNMRGVFYTRTDMDDGARHTGVIAQEMQEQLPEVVHEDSEGRLSVSYGNIVGTLIEAIKDQQEQIEDLKSIIKEMKNGNHED